MQTLDELRKRQKEIVLDFKDREQKSGKILAKIAEHEKSIARLQRSLSLVLGICLLYTSPSPRDGLLSRMPSSA